MQTTKMIAKNPENQLPMLDCAKECTELTMPLRVSSVPSTESMKVIKINQTFQTVIMPRFSCIMTEWRKAVVESQGSREAFSTGSHPQYPPQPRTAYAQCAPSEMPNVRKSHATMVQRRVMCIHFSPG